MRHRLHRSTWPVLVLIAVGAITLLRYDRPLIRGDGVAYLAWLDTFVRDRDLDLTNQFERFRHVNTYQITWHIERQRFVDIFPFGAAIVHAPSYALADALAGQGWTGANPGYFRQMQGVEQVYSLALMIGANALALGAMLLALRLARPLAGAWSAAFLAWAVLAGSPLLYYSTVTPLNSHNPAAFLLALMLYLLMTRTGTLTGDPPAGAGPAGRARALATWAALGGAAGLMVLVRWQLIAVAGLGWIALAVRRQWTGLVVATAAAALTLVPLPLVWNHLFGDLFIVPYDETTGEQFMGLPVNAHRVLGQMIGYAPLTVLSLLGLPALWRRDRLWAGLLGGMIAVQVLINGAARDWYAGDTFGPRRMSELYAVYVLLLAALAGRLPAPSAWRSRHAWRPLGARLAVMALLVYSLVLFRAFLLFTWTNPQGQFADEPGVMLRYWRDHPAREETYRAVLDAHVGPAAWNRPGP